MDIRGIEITNQLRSAIRAKLLELGVRYDEELPDYILVMVVNKKSRQQMNSDLQLFLEDSTETFVNWLHDQVLKKLQKVTIAKKKNSKETASLLPIKKEEDKEQKKVKEEDKSKEPASNVRSDVITKHERDREFEELVGDLAILNEDDNSKTNFTKEQETDKDKNKDKSEKKKNFSELSSESNVNSSEKKETLLSSVVISKSINAEKKISSPKQLHSEFSYQKSNDSAAHSNKRKSNDNNIITEKNDSNNKRSKICYDSGSDSDNRIKSTVNKPKITSVVSVKTRLGVISPSKKVDSENKTSNEIRSVSKLSDFKRNETNSLKIHQENKNDDRRRQKNEDLHVESSRDRSGSGSKNNKQKKIGDLREKVRLSNKSGTVKSRLGIITSQLEDKLLKPTSTTKVSKPRISNVKSRLGVKVSSKAQNKELSSGASRFAQILKDSSEFEDKDDDDDDDDDTDSLMNTSLKSHIIAVQKPKLQKLKDKSLKILKNHIESNKDVKKDKHEESIIDDEEQEEDQSKLPSKVIVTPRPLKPLQPSQKRATQSLLLRAVAEANQSVVMQKKMDPCLKEQKQKQKQNSASKIKITRDPREGKILSINLKKRLGMDRIQIELTNKKKKNSKKSHFSQDVTEKDLNVVKSLFQRSDNKQQFLVTLNGYNNNVLKEKNSDDEERLEMDVNEDDEFELSNSQYEIYLENDQMLDNNFQEYEINNIEHDNHNLNDDDMHNQDFNEDYNNFHYIEQKVENNENCKKNLKHEEISQTKRKKHSPIVYTRSRSNSPNDLPLVASTVNSVLNIDKRPLISSVITTVADKSSEKCRYWPNCTLGIKCAYFHPDVPCSSFPACKFGDKCAYKHPKCKFGSSCTKLGCIFAHPPVQCKYHPYCMKPGCPFSHPKTNPAPLNPLSPLPPDISTVRAKFTWKKKE